MVSRKARLPLLQPSSFSLRHGSGGGGPAACGQTLRRYRPAPAEARRAASSQTWLPSTALSAGNGSGCGRDGASGASPHPTQVHWLAEAGKGELEDSAVTTESPSAAVVSQDDAVSEPPATETSARNLEEGTACGGPRGGGEHALHACSRGRSRRSSTM